ncbi:unnamed protein product [Cylindrotheca closterium]|uniref:Uncharacterized protein n=1 Tax=Cylindrotheca closterium TaxID=2856 RepID=A0AAD2JPH6_9STRA|nr:unnamed protein product [Cylindrotheca closterium]
MNCLLMIATICALFVQLGAAFTTLQPPPQSPSSMRTALSQPQRRHSSSTALSVYFQKGARSNNNRGKEKSKRQYRVNQLVQSELGKIIHTGIIKGDCEYLDDDLRKRISIVNVDVSPDLRQARVTTSIRNASSDSSSNNAMDKRRAYSWLVQNTYALRHTLAQKMSHMKSSPSLTFVQVDVAAAVDVMYLIEKVSSGYGREKVGEFGGDDNSLPRGFIDDMDFDEELEDHEWDDEDDDFFDLEEGDGED